MVFTERDKRKKYNDIFEKRFNKETGLSTTKEDPEFFTDYVNKIFDEYKHIITKKRNSNDNDYMKREKIRLEANLKNLETQKFDFSYTLPFITILSTLLTFGIGQSLSFFSDDIKFSIQNVLKTITDTNTIKKFNNVFKDWSYNVGDLVIVYSIVLIVVFGSAIIAMTVISNRKKQKNDRLIAFNRMCLEVLNEFKDELK